MKQPIWLLEQAVLSLQAMLIDEHGGEAGLREPALLESALDRPKNKFAYELDVSFFELAAAYSFALAKNHPFIDGNKRIAFLVAAVFLEINGYQLGADEADAAVFFEGLASGEVTEQELAIWFESNIS